MSVYVDDMHTTPMGNFGRMKMCHMIADSADELLAMADKIGVQRKWLQYPGTHKEHFDIAMVKRAIAVKAGAIEITYRETAMKCRDKKQAALRYRDEHYCDCAYTCKFCRDEQEKGE